MASTIARGIFGSTAILLDITCSYLDGVQKQRQAGQKHESVASSFLLLHSGCGCKVSLPVFVGRKPNRVCRQLSILRIRGEVEIEDLQVVL